MERKHTDNSPLATADTALKVPVRRTMPSDVSMWATTNEEVCDVDIASHQLCTRQISMRQVSLRRITITLHTNAPTCPCSLHHYACVRANAACVYIHTHTHRYRITKSISPVPTNNHIPLPLATSVQLQLYIPLLSLFIPIRTTSHPPNFHRSHQSHLSTTSPPKHTETHTMSSKPLPEGIVRSSTPFLIPDSVTVTDPDLIRKIASHPHITRPAEAKLPWIFRTYFLATKFYYPPDSMFTVAQLGDGKSEQMKRRAIVEEQLRNGFTDLHIARLRELRNGTMDYPAVGAECAKIVADLILPLPQGVQLPDHIARASFDTLTDFPDVFMPHKYLRARRARAMAERYIQSILPDEKYPGDYVHHLGAAAQGFARAVFSLRDLNDEKVLPFLCQHPMIPAIIRVPSCRTTIDGLFPDDQPLLPDHTLIVFQIGAAASKTNDDNFLFGGGIEPRQCPFKDLFFDTAERICQRDN